MDWVSDAEDLGKLACTQEVDLAESSAETNIDVVLRDGGDWDVRRAVEGELVVSWSGRRRGWKRRVAVRAAVEEREGEVAFAGDGQPTGVWRRKALMWGVRRCAARNIWHVNRCTWCARGLVNTALIPRHDFVHGSKMTNTGGMGGLCWGRGREVEARVGTGKGRGGRRACVLGPHYKL